MSPHVFMVIWSRICGVGGAQIVSGLGNLGFRVQAYHLLIAPCLSVSSHTKFESKLESKLYKSPSLILCIPRGSWVHRAFYVSLRFSRIAPQTLNPKPYTQKELHVSPTS